MALWNLMDLVWRGSARPLAGVIFGGLLCSGSGCATRGNVELLEAQLRVQEEQIQSYQSQLSSTQSELDRVRREMDILRTSLASTNGTAPPQELTEALAAATSLTIHPLLTGGQDRDGIPGDEVLHAVIYPADQHGTQVKLAGELVVEAIELSAEPRRLGRWTYPISEARTLWHAGFLGSGYQIEVPWENPPGDNAVLVRATLKTPDGRTLDGSRTVTVIPFEGVQIHRPVPPLDDLYPPGESASVPEQQAALQPIPHGDTGEGFPQIPAEPVPLPEVQRPKAFPLRGTNSSDRWTDDTIPQWR